MQLAANKQLQVDLNWVKNPLPLQEQPLRDRMTARHPITGTSERYSLYDRSLYDQKNQNVKKGSTEASMSAPP